VIDGAFGEEVTSGQAGVAGPDDDGGEAFDDRA
jgi:hypothetical protein